MATIMTIIAVMMEGGGGDCAYNENKCGNGIVGPNKRGAGGGGGSGG